MLRKLPRRVDRITAALADGRFTTSLRLFSDPRDIAVVTTLVNRAVLGLLGAALGMMSVISLLAGSGQLGDGVVQFGGVAARDRHQHASQRGLLPDVEPPHRAEVDQSQLPGAQHQDVARMRVGVKRAL